MINIPSHIKVELKPLRKNSVKANYRVLEEHNDGIISKIFTYETMREAVYHAATNKNGVIIAIGASKSSNVKAFYCKHYNRMSFAFGASDLDKSVMSSDFYWAGF